MKNLKERLKEIEELKFDWNGYDAEPIPTETLYNTSKVLEKLENNNIFVEWEMFPTARESIQLEKDINNCYVEIEIFDDHLSLYMAGKYNVDMDNVDLNSLVKELKFLIEGDSNV